MKIQPPVLNCDYLTFSGPVIQLMRENNIRKQQMWEALTAETSIHQSDKITFQFYGRIFTVTRNSYGGPYIQIGAEQ